MKIITFFKEFSDRKVFTTRLRKGWRHGDVQCYISLKGTADTNGTHMSTKPHERKKIFNNKDLPPPPHTHDHHIHIICAAGDLFGRAVVRFIGNSAAFLWPLWLTAPRTIQRSLTAGADSFQTFSFDSADAWPGTASRHGAGNLMSDQKYSHHHHPVTAPFGLWRLFKNEGVVS